MRGHVIQEPEHWVTFEMLHSLATQSAKRHFSTNVTRKPMNHARILEKSSKENDIEVTHRSAQFDLSKFVAQKQKLPLSTATRQVQYH
jgi:hypothetical protein